MNLLPRKLIFLTHFLILLAFVSTHQSHYEFVLALLLHYLVLVNDSACFPQHCLAPHNNHEELVCMEESCRMLKWHRMRHCYKCQCCIHKFDHHCVLLDICIGQFNHKYYILLLATLLWNTLVICLNFTLEMKAQVIINQVGAQFFPAAYYLYAFSLIALYFIAILTAYLLVHHLFFISKNTTTWEYFKRDSITYLANVNPNIRYPFDRGIVDNWKTVFASDRDQPQNWAVYLTTLIIL